MKTTGNVWFTSDTHYCHGNIIKYCNRPFLKERDIKALEGDRESRINGGWHKDRLDDKGGSWDGKSWTGEFDRGYKITREAIESMNNHLIDKTNEYVGENDTLFHLGDFCFAKNNKYRQTVEHYRNRINCQNIIIIWGNHDQPNEAHHAFQEDHMMINGKILGQRLTLCHYAMAVWDGSHKGNIHLYGHSHSTAEAWLDKVMHDRNSIDVGVDNIAKVFGEYRPVSLDEIKNHLKNRTGHRMDHHRQKM